MLNPQTDELDAHHKEHIHETSVSFNEVDEHWKETERALTTRLKDSTLSKKVMELFNCIRDIGCLGVNKDDALRQSINVMKLQDHGEVFSSSSAI